MCDARGVAANATDIATIAATDTDTKTRALIPPHTRHGVIHEVHEEHEDHKENNNQFFVIFVVFVTFVSGRRP